MTSAHSANRRRLLPWLLGLKLIAIVIAALVLLPADRAFAVDSITTPDAVAGSSVGRFPSMVLDTNGFPVIAETSLAGTLRIVHCNDVNCAGNNESIQSVDTSVVVTYPSLALDASGFPVVAYHAGTSPDGVRLMHCNDANCAGNNESIMTVDSTVLIGGTGQYISMVLDASGFPVIAYQQLDNDGVNNFSAVKVAHCGNANCTSGNQVNAPLTVTPCCAASVGTDISMVIDPVTGFPVISYAHFFVGSHLLEIMHCDDVNCVLGGETMTNPDPSANNGSPSSIQLDGSRNPVVAYGGDPGVIRLVHCSNMACSGSQTIRTAGGAAGVNAQMRLDGSGFPVVAYLVFNFNLQGIVVLHCNDANCVFPVEQVPDTLVGNGQGIALRLDGSGFPVVAYTGGGGVSGGDTTLKVLHCDDPFCVAAAAATATPTPPTTPIPTNTPAGVATNTPLPTNTPIPTNTPTSTPVVGAATSTPTATFAPEATATATRVPVVVQQVVPTPVGSGVLSGVLAGITGRPGAQQQQQPGRGDPRASAAVPLTSIISPPNTGDAGLRGGSAPDAAWLLAALAGGLGAGLGLALRRRSSGSP